MLRHQHDITLWNKLRLAAKTADGKLHNIGNQLRRRYIILVIVVYHLLQDMYLFLFPLFADISHMTL